METQKQLQVIQLAIKGQNVFFTESAGSGKSTLVKKIFRALPRKVAITASTGLAASQYADAHTVHAFTGIGTGVQPLPTILRYISTRPEILHRLKTTDTIMIDEISMISAKKFELISDVLQSVHNSKDPFGGMQVIACGDFRQLPPVRSFNDQAHYPFQSSLWKEIFGRYNIMLDEVFRQEDPTFIKILEEIADGKCSLHHMAILKQQTRNLNPADFQLPFIPAIYTHNIDAQHHNMTALLNHPGEIRTFKARDTGNTKTLNRETLAEHTLHLKVGVPVMLIFNCSQSLRNGMTGTVLGFENGLPVVSFPCIGQTVRVETKTWTVDALEKNEVIISTRTQIPLKLSWGYTVHKSQGLSLNAAEIHCRKVFAPGHLYVALSRVRSLQGVKLVGFGEHSLQPPPKEVLEFLDCLKGNRIHEATLDYRQTVGTDYCEDNDDQDWWNDDDSPSVDTSEVEPVNLHETTTEVSAGDMPTIQEMQEVLADDGTYQYLSSPPRQFDLKRFLTSLKDDSIFASQQNSPAYNINQIIDDLNLPANQARVNFFVRKHWRHIFQILQKHCRDKQMESTSYDRKSFSAHFEDLHRYITCDDISKDFEIACGTPLSIHHKTCMSSILFEINKQIIHEVADIVRFQQIPEVDNSRSSRDISETCKSKIRYVGGWAVAKCLNKYRRYISLHCTSLNNKIRHELGEIHTMKTMLESLVWSSYTAHEHSQYQSTLSVIDYKQYQTGGLVHISDCAYDFFVSMEEARTSLMSDINFNTHKCNLMSWAKNCLLTNHALKEKFVSILCIPGELIHNGLLTPSGLQLVAKVYSDIVQRYVNMGAGQFLRNVRRQLQIKKTEAHRKKVMQREQRVSERNEVISLNDIRNDSSEGKCVSHSQIMAKVIENPKYFNSRFFTKEDMKVLFGLYDIRFIQSYNKLKLNDIIVQKIRMCDKMPRPERS